MGLGELGQEELGKSFLLLAAFAVRKGDSWEWFWKYWTDHRMKAHLAFRYELVSPHRIELLGEDGTNHSGLPLRQNIKFEKEYAFYVNFEVAEQRFVSPAEAIERVEPANRLITLFYLSVTATHLQTALEEDPEFRYRAFGELALRFCADTPLQQQMEDIYERFSRQSLRHAAFLNALAEQIDRAHQFLQDLRPAEHTLPPNSG